MVEEEKKKDSELNTYNELVNQLEGEALTIVPYVSPVFQFMGATAKVNFLLIVEKIE